MIENYKTVLQRLFCLVMVGLALAACSDSSDSPDSPAYDFTAAEQWLAEFVAGDEAYEGAALIVVDAERGVLHQYAAGGHTIDTIYLLASVSKVPTVSLLMALADDPALDFDLDTAIENYLPYMGVYPGITAVNLVSNTSGIPGLITGLSGNYGAHMCQFSAPGSFPNADSLQVCAQTIYQTLLDGTVPPNVSFDYGGSQWHLAGAVAEAVGGDSWNNLFRQYIAEPCELEVFEYGNVLFNTSLWTGFPDSLVGRDNPNLEGGAIANIRDVATILRMHLNDGECDGNRVMSVSSAQRMRVDIGTALGSRQWVGSAGRGYGMGWWIPEENDAPTRFEDGGAYGSFSWIDTGRGYGGFVALAVYDDLGVATRGRERIRAELAPIIEQAIDAAQ